LPVSCTKKLLLESAFLDRANALDPRAFVTVKAVEYNRLAQARRTNISYFGAIIIDERPACQADPADLVYS
jgi:hypothetical protein